MFNPVHFNEQLVQSLLSFVVSAPNACEPQPAHSVKFINEDDARSVRFRLLKQIANPCGTDTDEHFNEFASADMEERNSRFTSDGTSQKGFSAPRRSHEQNAFWDFRTQGLKPLWVFQELNDLLQFLLCLFQIRNIVKSDSWLVLVVATGSASGKVEGLLVSRLHLPKDEEKKADEAKHKQERQDELLPLNCADGRAPKPNRNMMLQQKLLQVLQPIRQLDSERCPVSEQSKRPLPRNFHFLNLLLGNRLNELVIPQFTNPAHLFANDEVNEKGSD